MRAALLLGLLFFASAATWAQRDHTAVAVPYYRPAQVMAGLHRHTLLPQAQAFEREASTLSTQLAAWCQAGPALPLAAVQAPWRRTLAAWEQLSTPAIGPVLARRSPRLIDFTPTRPALIQRAIVRAPAGAAAMEQVGTPAKGLPALEWLLFQQPLRPATPACSYATEVAADVLREATALLAAYRALAEQEWEEAAGDTAFSELLNQWIGGLERLRWAQMDKPAREAASNGKTPAWPRAASGEAAASWARQWMALRTLAVFDYAGAAAPAPGAGLVPLETYLRGRGLNPLADRWREQVLRCDRAMLGLQPGNRARRDAAVRELARTKALAEAEVAIALEVSIGFSDADGD